MRQLDGTHVAYPCKDKYVAQLLPNYNFIELLRNVAIFVEIYI